MFNPLLDMSFLKGLIETLGSLFANSSSSSSSSPIEFRKNPNNRAMGVAIGNERSAGKLKGYFDLATEEIAKAVRAEEWALVDDAVLHYEKAQRILIEHKTRVSGLNEISTSNLVSHKKQLHGLNYKYGSFSHFRAHRPHSNSPSVLFSLLCNSLSNDSLFSLSAPLSSPELSTTLFSSLSLSKTEGLPLTDRRRRSFHSL
ncbi:unnamed protein product [Ilex paraguariensis]|uniref:Uncharacterized protein n=1 Tax=Ilex paraguariensis TaxID=185542 RepID=A0ABC8T8H2_9AQUA